MRGVVASAALILSLIAPPAIAQDSGDPGVDVRQHAQRHRIQQDVQSGERTRQETYRPTREQRRLRAKERRYGANGELTDTGLRRDANRASGDGNRQKHDDDQAH